MAANFYQIHQVNNHNKLYKNTEQIIISKILNLYTGVTTKCYFRYILTSLPIIVFCLCFDVMVDYLCISSGFLCIFYSCLFPRVTQMHLTLLYIKRLLPSFLTYLLYCCYTYNAKC